MGIAPCCSSVVVRPRGRQRPACRREGHARAAARAVRGVRPAADRPGSRSRVSCPRDQPRRPTVSSGCGPKRGA